MSGSGKANYDTESSDRFIAKRRSNIKSDLIEITEDKLENILIKHLKKIDKRKGWAVPLGISISVILALIASSFSDKFGIHGNTWEALFIISACLSTLWLLYSIVLALIHWKKSTIEWLLKEIKDSE